MRVLKIWLSAVGYPLSAVRCPREREMVRLSDVRLAWYLETYSLLTASHIKVGDFSTPLRCARNDMCVGFIVPPRSGGKVVRSTKGGVRDLRKEV